VLRQTKRVILFSIGLLFSFAVNAQSMDELFRQSNSPIGGNPKGKITVVDFFDYQCEHCIKMTPVISAVIKSDPNVRVVFKDFPILGPVSQFAARAALAANMQGKYYQFHHALMSVDQPLTEDVVLEVAKSAGLNVDKLKKDMDSPAITRQLNENMALAKNLKVYATPTFFIGKTNATKENEVISLMGDMSQTEFQNAIDNVK